MRRLTLWTCVLACLAAPARAEDRRVPAGWPPEAAAAQARYEAALLAVPDAARLRAWHDLFCREPHSAGSEGDARTVERMAKAFDTMGLDVQRHDFWAYLPRFVSARVSVHAGNETIALPLRERPLPEDPSVAEDVPPAWNAYAGSGAARGQVVYANYGTKADFAKLEELGVSLRGRIVVARYGRNYRGYKAKFAEAAGAAGLLMYTDPDDAGYRKGIPYPEGGYANETSIQRGSVKTLAYPGDPLTPFQPATEDAERLDPASVALPGIPVQPLGWRGAHEILARMTGPAVPEGWQGGLPFAYRLTGGAELAVAMEVRQEREVVPTANVIGRVRGTEHPEQMVIVGCHHDAWTFGAGDPGAGTIVLFEMARSFAEAAKAGHRPARTVVFANWGAEEYGVIGSTEWCEANRQALSAGGVAYVNLDMAAMGPNFRSAAAPALKRVIEDATRAVPQARAPGQTVHEAWTDGAEGEAKFGNLGGGSDHVGFYCHLGIPSCGLGAGGSRGVSYHSAYDTVRWYRQVVGEDYEPALMLARVGNVLVSRLANAPVLPYDLARPAQDALAHVEALRKRPKGRAAVDACKELVESLKACQREGAELRALLDRKASAGALSEEALRETNARLLRLERRWLSPDGLPGRPWYRNLYAASDPWSGYASWMLPLLRHAAEDDASDPGPSAAEAAEAYLAAVRRVLVDLQEAGASLRNEPALR